MQEIKINAKFKYRYMKKNKRSYIYIITLWGGQEIEVDGSELKQQILAGNIDVDGLELKDNKLIPTDEKYYLTNAKKEAVQSVYVCSLIEGLVLGETLQLTENLIYDSGKLLDKQSIVDIQKYIAPNKMVLIRDNLGVRNYIANDDILCDQLSCFYTYICNKLLQQQKYTDIGKTYVKRLKERYLDNTYFKKDKNLLYQLYLLYEYHSYTFEHCCSVAIYSALIGMALDLDDNYIDDLFLGGLLHDIGKRKIPVALLDKNGKLTDEEFEIIMSHAYIGYTIVSSLVGFNSPIFKQYSDVKRMQRLTQGVMGHHAKLDGSGYPKGYADEYFTTQIITCADIFDALTSSRSYKAPAKNSKAINILKQDVFMKKLNKDCVFALIELIDKKHTKHNNGYTMFKNNETLPVDTCTSDIYLVTDIVS